MSVNFSAFEIGRRAINANQVGIDITGQNIANVNTPGYSRRSLQLSEAGPNSFSPLAVGNGVSIQGIQAYRDKFIESRIQREIGIAGNLSARRDALYPVESALQGGVGSGIQNALSDFFGAFRDLEVNPDSVPLRSIVAGRAETLGDTFRSTANRLSAIRAGTDGQLRATADAVNQLAAKIAGLNTQIRDGVNAGARVEGLKDTRNELINQISELTGARTYENDDSTITVTIGEGKPLVLAGRANLLELKTSPPYGLTDIFVNGEPVTFDAGVIKGYQSAIGTITSQLTDLDGLAGQIAARVNALHTSGTDLNGNAGIEFFDTSTAVTAINLKLNPLIAADARLVVASPLAQPGQSGTVAGEIANLLSDTGNVVGSKTGSFSSIFGSMITEAGANVRAAEDGLQTQAAIIAQASAQREAFSGVSLDEEAINLLQYQRAFDAAAKFIRIADEMTQTILSLAN